MGVFGNPPPNSPIAQRFLNMTLNQSDTHVPKSFHDKQVQIMRDIIELQAHLADASRGRLLAIIEQVKCCREKLSESTATLTGVEKVQSHIDAIGSLVKQFLTMEHEAGVTAEQLNVLGKEVTKEMAAAGFVPSSDTAS